MSESQLFQPEALKRVHRLELRAKYLVEGLLSGKHKSPFFGQSLEFLQHRQYTPGDDLRRIDWKVWGKQDRFYVKQFEDETNLRATLLVDASASMRYNSTSEGMSKYEYAATLAVSLAYLLLKQKDAVGLVRFDDEIRQTVPQQTSRNHLLTLIQTLEKEPQAKKTEISEILRKTAEMFPRRGLILLFSDLFVPRTELWQGLKALRSRGHDVLVFHILDPEELDFTFQGPTRFEGLEMPDILRCNPRALREGYLAEMQTYLEEIRRGCAEGEMDYALVRTTDSLDKTLSRMLLKRLK
ncbi:MAG: DUF58 domain-containing protein [Planctomycetia bacterium]|nr:DUF58 domain-containing protein [Planctomycetia bacterium]